MKVPSKDELRQQLELEKAQNRQNRETIQRTQQLLLDFIHDAGYKVFFVSQFGTYRFVHRSDSEGTKRLIGTLIDHRSNI